MEIDRTLLAPLLVNLTLVTPADDGVSPQYLADFLTFLNDAVATDDAAVAENLVGVS